MTFSMHLTGSTFSSFLIPSSLFLKPFDVWSRYFVWVHLILPRLAQRALVVGIDSILLLGEHKAHDMIFLRIHYFEFVSEFL